MGGELWPIQCCAQNVETGLMADVQKQRELPLDYSNAFCLLEMKRNNGRNSEFDQEVV